MFIAAVAGNKLQLVGQDAIVYPTGPSESRPMWTLGTPQKQPRNRRKIGNLANSDPAGVRRRSAWPLATNN
jgi:hypothetical protein